jgi:hypothetical protein
MKKESKVFYQDMESSKTSNKDTKQKPQPTHSTIISHPIQVLLQCQIQVAKDGAHPRHLVDHSYHSSPIHRWFLT